METEATLATRHPKAPLILSGNQAVARGAIEGGAALVTGYPGTPSTYVIESLLRVPDLGCRVEWAINEKVAFELATGVSWSGLRSLVTMKMSGLNVAADAFLSVQFSGTVGGLVLYVADDPNAYYGMVEQDSRYYARLASAPMLMPASPQEALDFTRRAFELSEQIRRPVMVLGTTTLANTSESVTLGEVGVVVRKPSFEFNVERYTKAGPSACVQQHTETLQALGRFGRLTDSLNVMRFTGSRIGVIAAGVAWNYLQEAEEISSVAPSTLKLGVGHPLPMEKIKAFVSAVDTVIVLEELEPVVEEAVMAVRAEVDHPVRVIGKVKGPLSRTGDYDVDVVLSAFREAQGSGEGTAGTKGAGRLNAEGREFSVERLNTFCAGCPHRATYYALNEAIVRLGYKKEEVIITGDIGCTILGMNEPFRSCWTEIAMGSSISLAQGFKYAGIKTPVIATMGDGTFFHAGIPALLNASHHQTDLTIVILDNHWISMTGMQPHVGSIDLSSPGDTVAIRVEDIVKAAGVQHVRRINPYRTGKMIETLMESIVSPGITVVIADAECALQRNRRKKTKAALKVKTEKCIGLDVCKPSCMEILGCPAIERGEDGKALINPDVCTACGLCRHVCSHGAI